MPAAGSTFRTDDPMLRKLLEQIGHGIVQLPDFQRGWIWDDRHIRALLASVTLSYPIGAVMLLESGDHNVRFKPRSVEGVDPAGLPEPTYLILDGQQRLTSLYLALSSGKPVPTRTEKGQDIQRLYYLDMAQCLDPEVDRIDAIVAVPPDRMIKSDFGRKIDLDVSTREREYAAGLFPVNLLFDIEERDAWRQGYQEHFDYSPAKIQFYNKFESNVWQRVYQYQVPVIELVKGTPKEAVCQVFEQVNTGGVTLSVFELVTATFAADDYRLRQDWEERQGRLARHALLKEMDATSFLTAVTLLASYHRHLASGTAVSCKRKDVLKLTLEQYKAYEGQIEAGLVKAARLLTRQKVFDIKALPYTTQLVPLSAICAFLDRRFEEDPVKQQLMRWYWCGVFGELYGGANETRFALDLPDVIEWIDSGNGNVPRTVRDAAFSPTRLLSLQTRNSAAYKGMMCLLMQAGSHDFVNGDPVELTTYFARSVDIHHVFPRAYCERKGLQREIWNSVVNKAPLTSTTNWELSGDAPSAYLKRIETAHRVKREQLDGFLKTHLINPNLLRGDNFGGFVRDRGARCLDLIEKAMGKAVSGRDSNEVVKAFGGALVIPG
jgi:hypothetical protein